WPMTLVTVGRAGDGYPLLLAYLCALDSIFHYAPQSIIVTGPFMPIEKRRALELAAARRPGVRIISVTTELRELICRADLVVAMAGYNTTVEILVAKKRAILVPRAAPRMEQRLRATLLSNMGLASVVQPEEDMVVRLAELIQAALAGARQPRHDSNAMDLSAVHPVRT